MINIISGATNSVVLRLDETADIYLFEVRSIQSNEVFYFTAENISPSDKFFECKIYEVSGTEVIVAPTASQPAIELSYGGSYNYTIYATDNYDLEPTNKILDRGKLVFRNGDVLLPGTFDFEDNKIFGVFDLIPATFFILTETGEILQTEQQENLIYN
jgi:hypothetical protein